MTGRRALLGAGLAAGALGLLAACSDEKVQRVAPQPVRADDPTTQVPKTPAPTDAAEIFTGSFESAQMLGRETNWMVARPAGVTGELPVVVVLHALNTDHRAAFMGGLEMQSLMQDWATEGNAPFALASVDADRSYYHPRTDGTDGGAMVLDEFLPLLEGNPELGLRTDRIGFFGWSMGGYGALRLGAMLGAPRVAAIAVSSPALWADPDNTEHATTVGHHCPVGDRGTRVQDAFAVGAGDQISGPRPTRVVLGGHHHGHGGSVFPFQGCQRRERSGGGCVQCHPEHQRYLGTDDHQVCLDRCGQRHNSIGRHDVDRMVGGQRRGTGVTRRHVQVGD